MAKGRPLVKVEPPVPRRAAAWITTHSGVYFNVADPCVDDVRLGDIARALSMLCRFAGHCRVFYSVAEHSVRVAEALGPELALEGLLHDAAEAYMVDVPGPVKNLPALAGYRRLEEKVVGVVRARFGLLGPQHPRVSEVDHILAVTECRDLLSPEVLKKWKMALVFSPLPGRISPWSQELAERRFCGAFADAYGSYLKIRDRARSLRG